MVYYTTEIPQIPASVFLAQGSVVLGRVTVGEESSIWFNVVIRGDVHEIKIGDRTNIQDGTVVHGTYKKHGTYIGNDVVIGHNATVHACEIQDRAFIGMGAIILDGAVIEEGAMVGAGALIAPGKIVRKGELWKGSPGRFARVLSSEEIKNNYQNACHYVVLARSYLVL